MRVVEASNADAVGEAVAEIVRDHAPATLGVATGSSPTAAYRTIVARRLLPPTTRLYLLDEYIGLPPDDAHRYRSTIQRQLADGLQIPADQVFAPDVDDRDVEGAARHYEALIQSIGGVDLQICGLGPNGHLAFNEPGSPLDSTTRVVNLSSATRQHNAGFFARPDDVPARAVTQGLHTIRSAASIVLVVIGNAKADVLAAAMNGPVTPDVPASVLQLHPRVVIVADSPALCSWKASRTLEKST